ncbi:hypothetical protein BV392_12995 [Rhodovulum sulfidophilum]|nr:hypothetical protein BV392_12995 [Rhodovulum sulfidophilum]
MALVADYVSELSATARASLTVLTATLARLDEQIETLDAEIGRRARENAVARRFMTVPGIGPLIATPAPPPEMFRKGRDFAAWLGLTSRQHSTGGKQRLGATTKMDERSLRRLLIFEANSVIIKRHCHASVRPPQYLAGGHAGAQAWVARANKMRGSSGSDEK